MMYVDMICLLFLQRRDKTQEARFTPEKEEKKNSNSNSDSHAADPRLSTFGTQLSFIVMSLPNGVTPVLFCLRHRAKGFNNAMERGVKNLRADLQDCFGKKEKCVLPIDAIDVLGHLEIIGLYSPTKMVETKVLTLKEDNVSQEVIDARNSSRNALTCESVPVDGSRYSCAKCAARETIYEKFKVCSRCHVARYCSKECQVEHWKLHKKECPEMKHTGIQSTSIFTGKDLEFNFDKRASNLVQYSANSLILLSAAWANSDEKLPVSLVIDIDNSAIAKGFTPPYRYTVQKLKLAPVDTSPAISTLSPREKLSHGSQAELPRWVNETYPEIFNAYQSMLDDSESDMGNDIRLGQAIFVVVVCRSTERNFVKCLILKSKETGARAMQLFRDPRRHPDDQVHKNAKLLRYTKFMFVEPTISRNEGHVPSNSASDHANMIMSHSGFVGDDDLCILTSKGSERKLQNIDHSCYAYLVV